MNIVITMAGSGRRFADAGVKSPKYAIEVRSKTLLEWSLLSLSEFTAEYFVFVTQQKDDAQDDIARVCNQFGIKEYAVVELENLTDGQATSVMRAEKALRNRREPLLIYNVDTYVEEGVIKKSMIQGKGWLPYFEAEGNRWSFLELGENDKVVRVTEKERISTHASVGLYYFESFDRFAECYRQVNFSRHKEKYVAPLYNALIETYPDSVFTSRLDRNKVHVLGTPEDIKQFDPEWRPR